jgi:hypothetical protein
MNKQSLFFSIFLLLTGLSFAQRFPEDSVKFVKELDAYFQEFSADKKDAKKWVDDFEQFWKKPDFSPVFRNSVYKICNQMAAKKMKPTPFFKDFLTAVGNFISNKLPVENYPNWQTVLEKVLSAKSNRPYGDFLEMSVNLFTNNTFFKSPTYEWVSGSTNYKFEYDSLPKVTFPDLTLIGTNPRGDSISIEKTKGTYYPVSGKFYGTGGAATWERVGLEPEVRAEVKKYTVDCKAGGYTLDSVTFYYSKYLDKPQKGVLRDKIITERDNPTYPRFDSYSKRLIVKNVAPEVDFDGGFAMVGPRFVGSGDATNPAKLLFKRNAQKFLEVSSLNFVMAKDKISSDQAAIKFILEKDSIIHPGLSFKYLVEQKKISLIRTDDGLQRTPFYSSFHKFDMYFEEMTWKLDEPKIDFGFIAGNFQGEAYFESEDFFTAGRLTEIQGMESVNPLYKINEFYEKNGKKKSFPVNDLAVFMKWLSVDLRPLIIKVATFGLVYYNPQTDVITIKEKLFNYLKASKKQRDYDVLTVHSVNSGKVNGTLNLVNNNFDLNLKGVSRILLSDSQKVFIFPSNGEITLKKNRDMDFKGIVAAGKFEFHGKDFHYSYEKNKIDLKNVDSLRIYVEPFADDEIAGTGKSRKVQTVLENINGEMDVDHPNSHSGRLNKPEFPIFKSFKECYAFYDKRSIQKGVYNRNKFYFKLDPFTIDSLDNFTNKALRFEGEFASSDIFPNFRETLTLQKDYSLGFIRKTPPGGYQLYGGKAKFDNEVRLSNKGLRGDGTIEFGPSITKSEDFIYYPDSMNGMATTFDVKETESPDEFPQAHGDQVYIHWEPYKDILQANDKKDPFTVYTKSTTFHGRFSLSPTELHGRGKVDFERADILSKDILFKKKKFFADTADFHLRSFDEEGFTFSTDNVKATIDFETRSGLFISNGQGSVVRFDKNKYICYMDRFKWFMDSENIQMGDEKRKIEGSAIEEGVKIEGPEFISIHPQQDSLRFYAPAANYNLRKNIIECINVPFVNVADSKFFPDSGKVIIFKNAVMDTLKNAVILTNTVTKFHNIRNVKGNIYGRRSYLASGDYTYYDENNSPYNIHFATIKPDTAGQTLSEGFIPEKDNFKFNDYFSFAGKVFLVAPSQYLFFEGGTRMTHNCGRIGKSYLQFSGEINPKEIFIPIPKTPTDVDGKRVVNALMYSPDTTGVYSGFVSPKPGRNDKEIISADGFLTFDKTAGEYRISNKEKLVEQNLSGNYLSLNTNTCLVYGEGKFDIGADLGQVEAVTVGSASHYTINDSAVINLMMTLNFFFEDKALKKMASDVEVYLNTLPATDFSKTSYSKGLTEIMGKEKAEKAASELQVSGKFRRFPDELEKSFFFNDVNFIYDGSKKSFISTGGLGLGNILKTEINREVPGVIRIDKKKKGGDMLYIYIELDASTWYYFEYFNGNMKAVSSNNEFNTIIKELKPKKRKQDVSKGPGFQYNLGNPTAAKNWASKFYKK